MKSFSEAAKEGEPSATGTMAKELAMRFRSRPAPVPEKFATPGIFESRKRLELFSYLCLHPCATLTSISKKMRTSTATVRWHLKKLEPTFVTTYRLGKQLVAAPTGMLLTEDVPVFTVLNTAAGRNTYRLLLNTNTALTAREIAAATGLKRKKLLIVIAILCSRGLLKRVKDGRLVRYTVSDMLETLHKTYAIKMAAFRRYFISKLAEAGYSVKIESSSSTTTLLWLGTKKKKRTLVMLSTAPYKTVLE